MDRRWTDDRLDEFARNIDKSLSEVKEILHEAERERKKIRKEAELARRQNLQLAAAIFVPLAGTLIGFLIK